MNSTDFVSTVASALFNSDSQNNGTIRMLSTAIVGLATAAIGRFWLRNTPQTTRAVRAIEPPKPKAPQPNDQEVEPVINAERALQESMDSLQNLVQDLEESDKKQPLLDIVDDLVSSAVYESEFKKAIARKDTQALENFERFILPDRRQELLNDAFVKSLISCNFDMIDFFIEDKLVSPTFCVQEFLKLKKLPDRISDKFKQELFVEFYRIEKTAYALQRQKAIDPEESRNKQSYAPLNQALLKYNDGQVVDKTYELACREPNPEMIEYYRTTQNVSVQMCEQMQRHINDAFEDAAKKQPPELKTLDLLAPYASPEICKNAFRDFLVSPIRLAPSSIEEIITNSPISNLRNVVYHLLYQSMTLAEGLFKEHYSIQAAAKILTIDQRQKLLTLAIEKKSSVAVSAILAMEKTLPTDARIPDQFISNNVSLFMRAKIIF